MTASNVTPVITVLILACAIKRISLVNPDSIALEAKALLLNVPLDITEIRQVQRLVLEFNFKK